MNSNQNSHINMFLVVAQILADNLSIYTGLSYLTTLVDLFGTENAAFLANLVIQEMEISGVAVDKADAKASTAVLGDKIALALFVMFDDAGNDEAALKYKYTDGELEAQADITFAQSIERIHEAAVTHAAALVPFGVVANDITNLSDAYDEFMAHQPTVQIAIQTREVHGMNLDRIIQRQMENIAKMKIRFKRFRTSNPDFYNLLINGMNIIQSGGGSGHQNFSFTGHEGQLIGIDATNLTANVNIRIKNNHELETPGVFQAGFSNMPGGSIVGPNMAFVPGMELSQTATLFGYTDTNKYLVLQIVGPGDVAYEVEVG